MQPLGLVSWEKCAHLSPDLDFHIDNTAALLSSAPEQQETHFATSNNKPIEPPYVRIAIHPHAWCENVPTRLQDTVSPT
jgi:hypothetical protein